MVEYKFESTCASGSATCHATYIIRSNGWSGKVIKTSGDTQEERTFKFHGLMTISGSQDGTLETSENAYVDRNEINVSYIGISLEHFGEWWRTGWSHEKKNQILGLYPLGETASNPGDKPAYGAKSTDSVPSFTVVDIISEGYTNNITSQTYGPEHVVNIAIGTVSGYRGLMSCEMKPGNGDGWIYDLTVEIETDLPIFETDADLMVYCNSRGEDTSTILNIADPEEEYINQFKFHYIKNIYGHNTRNANSYTGFRNYRIFPASKRLCFYRVQATTGSPFTLRLKGANGATFKSAPVYADPHGDDNEYTAITGDPELYYLHKSISFSENNYYSKFAFTTDLPIFGSASDAQDYIDNIIDERSAENWNDISRAYSETVEPGYGDPDSGNDNGVNGQSYVKGARLWVMESSDLNHFFDDIFSDINISDILHGTQLFGQSAISCIMGVMYLPVDVDDVATVNGTKDTIKLGSWACPTAQGRYVWNNNKIIDCGSFFVARVYNDFRDYEMKLSLDLPYVGTVETSIGRFLGKTLSIKYAVDITTGGCTAHIYADSIEMESYDGFMASLRPIQAIDQISHLNAVMGIIGSIGSRETGMINTATEGFAGVATGSIGGNSKGGFNAPSSGVGPGGALELSAGAITDLYSLGQAVKDKPIAVRGSYAGCLGLFGPQKIHVRVQQPRIYRAENLLQIAGYPSGIGGRVGMFSGFLSVMSFQIADGFPGTADELQEIYGILKQGIYI